VSPQLKMRLEETLTLCEQPRWVYTTTRHPRSTSAATAVRTYALWLPFVYPGTSSTVGIADDPALGPAHAPLHYYPNRTDLSGCGCDRVIAPAGPELAVPDAAQRRPVGWADGS
jgi:hypothetical protein